MTFRWMPLSHRKQLSFFKMTLLDKETRLADALMEFPELIPVVDRLGVSPGVAEKSVETICCENSVDPDFFLAVVNTFINKDYFPTNATGRFQLEPTADYLRKTSAFYKKIQLPNIDRHFDSLISRSGKDNNLPMLREFYLDVRNQLEECLSFETTTLLPSLESGIPDPCIKEMITSFTEVEEKLHDLIYFFVAHLKGNYDHNLCNAVITSVFALWQDYLQNNRIRTRILLPLANYEKIFPTQALS